MKVNSFFCGAGGFDLGFIQAGFEIVGAYDFDKYAVESYNHNIGGAVQADVTQLKGEELKQANGWLFGFPCQDISVAGKQAGMIKGETRSGLFYEIMRLLGEVSDKPEWILAENVKAVNKFIPTIEEEYEKAGYKLVDPQLYNSKYWGVPQNRERYFLFGIRSDLAKTFVFPTQQTDFIPKLSSVLESNVDEKYYISDDKAAKIIEQAMNRIELKQTTGCSLRTRTYADQPQQLEVRKDGISNYVTTVPKDCMVLESQPELKQIQSIFTDKDGAAYCCDANYFKGISPGDVGNGRRTHIIEPKYRVRKLTPREYARLQGFLDSYEQVVSNSQFYKQMGNAVTVNVSYAIAVAIKEQFHGA